MNENLQTTAQSGESSELRAPYPPLDAFLMVFEKIRSRSGTPIDAGVLEKWGLSKSNAQKVLPALRFLGIIDQVGSPLPLWAGLAVRDQERYRKTVEDMLHKAYAKLLGAYPSIFSESDDKLSDAIGDVYETSASTRAAAVNFLKRMLSEAGLRELREIPQQQSLERKRSVSKRAVAKAAEQPGVHGGVSAARGSDSVVNVHVHINVGPEISETELVDFLRRVSRAKKSLAAENG